MNLIDTHAHLDDSRFEADFDAMLDRAAEVGVEAVLCVGICAASSAKVVHLARQHEMIHAAVGIQPNSCAEAQPGDWDRVVELVEQPEVIALGETGLDRYWDYTPFEMQQDYFDRHLRLSQERDLPVLIHCRDCDDDVLTMLRDARLRGPLRGLIHSFSGSQAMADECLELGLYLSFSGAVSYTNKKFGPLRDVASSVPADWLLIETDSPYLTPHPLRGKKKRNEPALIVHTLESLAALRGCSAKELAAQTTANARALLGIGGEGRGAGG
ncbi:MAG: TatD family hydrolase [Pirellulales bacterium]|nr:TatD family hydrolase [Pirellulales bacterium]